MEGYTDHEGEIRYREMVCGTEQIVDASLPEDALAAVRSGKGIAGVADRYGEPMAALQDKDLYLPGSAELAYYAIYNLFRRYALGADVDDWLLVNQAGSSEEDERKWTPMLVRAIEKALQER